MSRNDTSNPLGTDGFEFVEFTAPTFSALQQIESNFEAMGFAAVAKHRHKDVWLYRQGSINFIVNGEQNSQASEFASNHGSCVNAMGFKVKDIGQALAHVKALNLGIVESQQGPMELNLPAIETIGGALLYLVEPYDDIDIYRVDFEYYSDWQQRLIQADKGLRQIDHLTHNVFIGNMDKWAQFYQLLANFQEIRHFDIDGKTTGLLSRAMVSPCGKIRIPINESKDQQSQIAEYLEEYNGEGIQHIALTANDIFSAVSSMRKAGVPFMDTPNTYYELLEKRLPSHGESLSQLKTNQILLDGDSSGLLLQIFTKTLLGPIFFEVIQRKGNEGFGEGNFQALFESIELEQMKEGKVDPTQAIRR